MNATLADYGLSKDNHHFTNHFTRKVTKFCKLLCKHGQPFCTVINELTHGASIGLAAKRANVNKTTADYWLSKALEIHLFEKLEGTYPLQYAADYQAILGLQKCLRGLVVSKNSKTERPTLKIKNRLSLVGKIAAAHNMSITYRLFSRGKLPTQNPVKFGPTLYKNVRIGGANIRYSLNLEANYLMIQLPVVLGTKPRQLKREALGRVHEILSYLFHKYNTETSNQPTRGFKADWGFPGDPVAEKVVPECGPVKTRYGQLDDSPKVRDGYSNPEYESPSVEAAEAYINTFGLLADIHKGMQTMSREISGIASIQKGQQDLMAQQTQLIQQNSLAIQKLTELQVSSSGLPQRGMLN